MIKTKIKQTNKKRIKNYHNYMKEKQTKNKYSVF